MKDIIDIIVNERYYRYYGKWKTLQILLQIKDITDIMVNERYYRYYGKWKILQILC